MLSSKMPKFNMPDFERRMFYRGLAAVLIWLLLSTAVFASVRSTRIVSRASRVAADAMTSAQERDVSGVREVARAFAVEWATWNGSPDEYRKRLGAFLKKPDVISPEGIQEVTSASVRDVQADTEKYRVRVILHTRLLVPRTPAEAQALPQVFIPVTREDVARSKQESSLGQEKNIPAWLDQLLCVEVPMQVVDGQATVIGMPVIVSPGQGAGIINEPRLSDVPTPEFVTFVKQFLGLYFGGGALANFLAPGTKIDPVAGWKLESVGEIYVDSSKNPTTASVRLNVSYPGVNHLGQRLFLKIQPERGSYLVKEISTVSD